MVVTEAWEGISVGAGVADMAVGVTSTGLRHKDMHGRFLIGDSGVL